MVQAILFIVGDVAREAYVYDDVVDLSLLITFTLLHFQVYSVHVQYEWREPVYQHDSFHTIVPILKR